MNSSLNAWQNARRKTRIKIISFLMSICFIFPYTAFVFDSRVYAAGAEAAAVRESLKANGAVIKIPEKCGIITGCHKSTSQYTVVYIQDLHCNYEVQSNIAAIIRLLAERNQLRLIGVEGDSEKVDVSLLADFPIKKVKIDIGQYFMRRGLITGAEYQAGTGDKPLVLEGIEDQVLYQANKKSLLSFLNEESQGYCEDIRDALVRLKKPVYNMGLAKLDHKREEYDYENVTLENYCDFLLGEARKLGIETASFKALTLYAVNHQLPLSATLDYERLLEDAEALDRGLRRKLYTSPDQRRLDHYLYLLKVMESMVNISATDKDLKYFRTHRKEFSAAVILRFLEEVCYRYVIEPDIDAGILRLDEFLAQAADFYKVADRRSSAFVRNLLGQMQSSRQRLAVLISGGFHAAYVEQALRENQVSYIAIKPRLTRTDAPNPYFSLIRNKRTSLDLLLARKENLFAPSTGFNRADFQRHFMLVKEAMLHLFVRLEEKLKGAAALARTEEVNKIYAAALAGSRALKGSLPGIMKMRLEFREIYSNPGKEIYTFQIKGQDFYIVLRPAGVITHYSELLITDEVNLGNVVMQFISPADMKQHSARILDLSPDQITGRAEKKGLPNVMAYLANLPMNIRQRVTGWFGAGTGEEAVIDLSIEQDDIIQRALAWSGQQGYSARLPLVGNYHLEDDLGSIIELAQEETKAGRPGLEKFVSTPARLALAGIAYHNGRLAYVPGAPTERVLALAKDFWEGERLAAEINAGKSLKELKLGNSPLARLVQAINNDEEGFGLGSLDAGNPERLMPEFYSNDQVKAMQTLVKESNIILEVSGPQFNPWLGFHPGREQVIAVYQKLIRFASGLGSSTHITVLLKNTRFVNMAGEIREIAKAKGVEKVDEVIPEGISITGVTISEILKTIDDWQRLGIEPQPALLESRFITGAFNQAESWKAARFLSRAGGSVTTGISSGLWAGMVCLVGGIISVETAVRTGVSAASSLMPNKYFAYQVNTGPRFTSPWVNSVMKSDWVGKNLQSAQEWPRAQAIVILGLLRVMNLVMAIDSGAVGDVLAILEAMPGEKQKMYIEIMGKVRAVSLPAMIFEQPSLLRRIMILPITDENGMPPQHKPKQRLAVENAA